MDTLTTEVEKLQVQEPHGAQPPPTEQKPAEELPTHEAPIQQIPIQQTPIQQIPVQQTPVQQTPFEQAPIERIPIERIPIEQTPIQQAPIQQAPIQHAPIQQAPALEAPTYTQQTPVEQPPIEAASFERAATEQLPNEKAPIQTHEEQAPIDQAPIEQAPVEQASVQQVPSEHAFIKSSFEQAPVEQTSAGPASFEPTLAPENAVLPDQNKQEFTEERMEEPLADSPQQSYNGYNNERLTHHASHSADYPQSTPSTFSPQEGDMSSRHTSPTMSYQQYQHQSQPSSRPGSGLSNGGDRYGYSQPFQDQNQRQQQPSVPNKNSVVIKVGMVGDAQIGKTSLMVKYVEGSWDEDYIQTLGVNFMEKTISIRNTEITFSIWDLGGQREFVNMLPLVCNDAVAILFMFDLTRKSTLNSIKEWYRQGRGFNKTAIPFLVGTKYDHFVNFPREDQEEISIQAKRFAKAMRASLIFSSTSHSINVQKIFKIVLSKAFDLKCTIPEIENVGEPLLLYQNV